MRASKGVGSVEYKPQVMSLCDRGKSCHIAGATPQVHAYDACGARSDHLLNLVRINIVSSLLYITENGSNTLPLECMSRGDKSE
jgi:hypothetical protein